MRVERLGLRLDLVVEVEALQREELRVEAVQVDEQDGPPAPVGGESGSTDIRVLLLVFLKVFRAFRVFLKVRLEPKNS